MKLEDIKKMLEGLYKQSEDVQRQIKEVRQLCPHPELDHALYQGRRDCEYCTTCNQVMDHLQYYYDPLRHMICMPYTVQNLHRMAKDLGIKRSWFHNKKGREHYDIPKKMIKEIMREDSRCIGLSSLELLRYMKLHDKEEV